MIAQNEINAQGKLANKTDNPTVSNKHCEGRNEAQTNNGDCTNFRY